jgi:hypothetical protein
MAYKYITATNWGKNFFTHQERRNFYLAGHPGDVWVVGDNMFGDQWIAKVSGVSKTKEEAQAIVDGKIAEAQAAWDELPVEQKNLTNRPTEIILP